MKIKVEFSSRAEEQLIYLVLACAAVMLVCLQLYTVRKRGMFRSIFSFFGVGLGRFKLALNEFRRKAVHFAGLLIPIIYYFGLHFPAPSFLRNLLHLPPHSHLFTPFRGFVVLFTLWVIYVGFDILRLVNPTFRKMIHGTVGSILRVEEKNGLSGSTFYLAGAFITVLISPPLFAIISLCFLTIGDFSAAIIGKIFGKTKLVGKKSLEGCLACFLTSFFSGLLVALALAHHFAEPEMAPWFWIMFTGAIVTTITELFSPGGVLNDNLTIPPLSALAMTLLAKWLHIDPSI